MKKVEAFLKEYASFLREEFDWSKIVPCEVKIKMASGLALVADKDGDTVAIFVTKVPAEEYNPSCPVSQRDVQAAKLLADVINYLGTSNGEEA